MKAIVVEDECFIRQGIIKKIDWKKFGITDVLDADNGVDAYELIISEKPDIVLLDICMPKMSGIELLELIRSENINCKVVILSGHDEFEHAQKAMRHGVEYYLLKPSSPERIEAVLGNICAALNTDAAKERDYRELLERNKKTTPYFRAGFIYSLIMGDMRDQDEIRSLGDYLGVDLGKKYCIAAVFALDDHKSSETPERIMLDKLEITEVIEEILCEDCGIIDHFLPRKVILILFSDYMDKLKWHCFDSVKKVCNNLPEHLCNDIYIGIGSVHEVVPGISVSFQEAVLALDYRFFDKKRHVYYVGDMAFDGLVPSNYPYDEEKNFIESIRLCKIEKAYEHLNAITDALKDDKSVKTVALAKIHLKQLVYQMIQVVIELEGNIEDLFGNGDVVEKLEQFKSITDYKLFLEETAERLCNYIEKKRYLKYTAVIRKVLSFVEENYTDESLRLEKIAEHVSMHPNYLSQFFKKHKGESLSSYICRFRVQKAEELLLLPNHKKVYDIAAEVGFSDAHYFSICFRNIKGVTPSEYRQTLK
ncbi:MAG: response regulator [Firmicutes bacterium]|nr:response regulator [Bacillota bacterium]